MNTFWDASAVVPLLLKEQQSDNALHAWRDSELVMAWEWMRVEVEAALMRRQANPAVWRQWRTLNTGFTYLRLEWHDLSSLLAMNRGLGLRAADAGHVHVFERVCAEQANLHLVTFDAEMAEAARKLRLPLHTACS